MLQSTQYTNEPGTDLLEVSCTENNSTNKVSAVALCQRPRCTYRISLPLTHLVLVQSQIAIIR